MKSEDTHRSIDYRRKALPRRAVVALLRRAQARLFERYRSAFPPERAHRILDLGVNASLEDRRGYFFEDRYPFPDRVVAAGLEDGQLLRSLFPEVVYVQVGRQGPLPFDDGEFDIVFANAVIEHVGSSTVQRQFLEEIFRVGRAAFVATPNRWFPVEVHTVLPLVHFLPTAWYRRLFRLLGFGFFAQESNLNLLDRKHLRVLVPDGVSARIEVMRTFGFVSNLLLVGNRRDERPATDDGVSARDG